VTTSLSSPAQIINNSLVRIGYKLRVGSLYEGSDAANKALAVYGQTRDEMLRDGDWGFAQRDVVLTLLKQAPTAGYGTWNPATNPPLPYIYEYAYPADCLKVRALKSTPPQIPNFYPLAQPFRIQNDNNYTPPQKVILCDVGSAILTYTGRVTDPTTWQAGFTEALCAALGRRLLVALGNAQLIQAAASDEAAEDQIAKAEQG
jgi:hypothetical protein